MKFIIYTDGASRGNPGPAAAGFVIQSPDGVIWVEEGVYLGMATNNVAEYRAVRLALEKLTRDFAKHLPTQVEVVVDSQLIARQLAGKYKIKNPNLQALHLKIRELESKIGQVEYHQVEREQNLLADRLANRVLDQIQDV